METLQASPSLKSHCFALDTRSYSPLQAHFYVNNLSITPSLHRTTSSSAFHRQNNPPSLHKRRRKHSLLSSSAFRHPILSFLAPDGKQPITASSAREELLGAKLGGPKRVPRTSPTLRFRDLKAADFQHPLDRQNTAVLRAFPGVKEIARMLLSPVAEQLMLLENIGTSVQVGEKQLANLHHLLLEASEILAIDPPDLYVRQNPVPNAYTLAIAGRKPFIVIHTSLVELLTPAELQAVLAHELGHLKCDHGIWLTFANLLALSAGSLPGFGRMIAANLEDQLLRWLRAAELTCDRAALLVAQDPRVVISVLMKLAGGCPSLAEELSVDAFLNQARSYDEASRSLVGWYISNAQTRQLSHPLPVMRAREIDQWAQGTEYKALIRRARAVERPYSVQRG